MIADIPFEFDVLERLRKLELASKAAVDAISHPLLPSSEQQKEIQEAYDALKSEAESFTQVLRQRLDQIDLPFSGNHEVVILSHFWRFLGKAKALKREIKELASVDKVSGEQFLGKYSAILELALTRINALQKEKLLPRAENLTDLDRFIYQETFLAKERIFSKLYGHFIEFKKDKIKNKLNQKVEQLSKKVLKEKISEFSDALNRIAGAFKENSYSFLNEREFMDLKAESKLIREQMRFYPLTERKKFKEKVLQFSESIISFVLQEVDQRVLQQAEPIDEKQIDDILKDEKPVKELGERIYECKKICDRMLRGVKLATLLR
jgi:hypothetical protein